MPTIFADIMGQSWLVELLKNYFLGAYLAEIERPLIPGLCLMTVNNYKIIIIPNDSLNLAYPVVIAYAELQPKETKCELLYLLN